MKDVVSQVWDQVRSQVRRQVLGQAWRQVCDPIILQVDRQIRD